MDLGEARRDDFGQTLGVEMPSGMLWNPLGKAFKRFGADDAESLESFYEQAARLTSDPRRPWGL